MSEAEFQEWAVGAKLSAATVDKLVQEGFACLDSIILLTEEDKEKSAKLRAISLGQWKLLSVAVGKLIIKDSPIQEARPPQNATASEDKVVQEVMEQLGLPKPSSVSLQVWRTKLHGRIPKFSYGNWVRDPQLYFMIYRTLLVVLEVVKKL